MNSKSLKSGVTALLNSNQSNFGCSAATGMNGTPPPPMPQWTEDFCKGGQSSPSGMYLQMFQRTDQPGLWAKARQPRVFAVLDD